MSPQECLQILAFFSFTKKWVWRVTVKLQFLGYNLRRSRKLLLPSSNKMDLDFPCYPSSIQCFRDLEIRKTNKAEVQYENTCMMKSFLSSVTINCS
ncbi:hypothetical protein ANCCAN_12906 [Ancylostoma caninum]|uniref:Uncharacterized protein n=1 Tax=Ancylostoma caninum TaxID=29170 RepID=A0A368G9X0_ANCCA|nr:hypothetical protein ANCCAN_12906 [Ancylostoma caninum]